jgi:hypothetical protein
MVSENSTTRKYSPTKKGNNYINNRCVSCRKFFPLNIVHCNSNKKFKKELYDIKKRYARHFPVANDKLTSYQDDVSHAGTKLYNALLRLKS